MRIHVVRVHFKVTEKQNRHVNSCINDKENQVITCHICGTKFYGIRGSHSIGGELRNHFETKNKEAFDDGVIKWEG